MFEFAVSIRVRLRSLLIVSVIKGGVAYQDHKVIEEPHQYIRKTRPYTWKGSSAGIDFALSIQDVDKK